MPDMILFPMQQREQYFLSEPQFLQVGVFATFNIFSNIFME